MLLFNGCLYDLSKGIIYIFISMMSAEKLMLLSYGVGEDS